MIRRFGLTNDLENARHYEVGGQAFPAFSDPKGSTPILLSMFLIIPGLIHSYAYPLPSTRELLFEVFSATHGQDSCCHYGTGDHSLNHTQSLSTTRTLQHIPLHTGTPSLHAFLSPNLHPTTAIFSINR